MAYDDDMSYEDFISSSEPIETKAATKPKAVRMESKIEDSEELIEAALQEIYSYQNKEKSPIKFKKDFINKILLGGLFPKKVIGIAGSSGHGKTTLAQELENDIFDKTLNPDCDDYILLRSNFEMPIIDLVARDIMNKTGKLMSEIYNSPFTPEEKALIDDLIHVLKNPRIKYMQTPPDPQTWLEKVFEFCVANQDKKMIVITIDHLALIRNLAAGKKDAIDTLIENINYIKNFFNNVSFILLSQLNRNIEERDNPKNSAPKKMDLYQSDFLYQLSDVIIVVHQPYLFGLQEHMVIGKYMFPHLQTFKKDPTKRTTSFLTKGLVFYHIIKMRNSERGTIPNLYIEKISNESSDEAKADFLNKDVVAELPRIESTPDIYERLDFDVDEDPFN